MFFVVKPVLFVEVAFRIIYYEFADNIRPYFIGKNMSKTRI